MLEAYSAVFPRPGPEWLTAPDERTPGFFPAFARISVAVQSLLRERVPAFYFADPRAFDNTKISYPMLVYQASQPFRGKMRTELTYDVLNLKTVATFFRSVRQALPGVLEGVKACLQAERSTELAELYDPGSANLIIESVQTLSKSRRCLYVLIRAEGSLVTTLIDLAGLGALPIRQQARRAALFQKKWRYQLRRMYPGIDFTWLAQELLEAATQALLQTSAVVEEEDSIRPLRDFIPQSLNCGE